MILILVENAYKVFVFENISEKKCFVWKMFWNVREQAIKNYLPTQKSFVFFSLPLDSAILPLVNRKPYHWMFEGQARVIVQS